MATLQLVVAALVVACGGGDGPTGGATHPAPKTSEPAVILSSAPGWPADAEPKFRQRRLSAAESAAESTTENTTGWRIDTAQRDTVLLLHRTVFASSAGVPVGWTGSVGGCDAGDSSSDNKSAIERRINWMRAMAGVPAAVRLDPDYNRKAQQAALIMAVNGQLSHAPPSNWACWTATGAEAAGRSNLTLAAGADAITAGYLADPGANNAPLGHRRWMLYPQTQRMGSGDVFGLDGTRPVAANAMWVFDDLLRTTRPAVRDDFVAWPPPGYVPHTVVYPRWSISYPDADFSQATVSMTENGLALATVLEPVTTGYGENTLAWLPGAYRDGMRWARPSADTRYEVSVGNVGVNGQAREFRYTVTVIDADAPAPWGGAQSLRGSARLNAGQIATYNVDPVVGATGYQWRTSKLMPLLLAEGAEQGSTRVTLETSVGYDPMPAGIAAEGHRAYHLAHAQVADQTVTLSAVVVPNAATRLRFASRLGWATTAQAALVEASIDDGRSWTELYRQAGTGGQGESAFTQRELSLAAWAGRSLLLRWRYAKPAASYFSQTTEGVGWYIDDIRVTDADTLAAAGAAVETVAVSHSPILVSPGRWLVQARPGIYGHWADWSAGLVVTAEPPSARIECLLDWAQRQYPQLLVPPALTQNSPPYVYRAYAGELYVGLSTTDEHVYLLRGGRLEDLGSQLPWMAQAGC